MARLQTLSGDHCRERAFAGFGWGLGAAFLAQRDPAGALRELQGITDPGLRWAACGGFAFILNHTDEATLAPQRRADVLRQMATQCRAPAL